MSEKVNRLEVLTVMLTLKTLLESDKVDKAEKLIDELIEVSTQK